MKEQEIRDTLIRHIFQPIQMIQGAGHKRVAVYGNGTHTQILNTLWECYGCTPFCAIITTEQEATPIIGGLPLVPASELAQHNFDAVLLSSLSYEREMHHLCTENAPDLPIYWIYNGPDFNDFLITQACNEGPLKEERYRILDAGALDAFSEGSAEIYWPGIPRNQMELYAFEPDEEECERMRQSAQKAGAQLHAFPYGIWSESGARKELYLTENRSGSSFYPPALENLSRYYYDNLPFDQQMDIAGRFEMPVTTIDQCRKEGLINEIDFVKLNIEGAERDALEGGRETLNNVLGVQIEMGFSEKVEGGPLFSDLDPMLREMGFEFYEILSLNRYAQIGSPYQVAPYKNHISEAVNGNARGFSQQVFEGHFLYFRKYSDIAPLGKTLTLDSASRLFKLACFQEMYGHLDAAFATLRYIESQANFELKEKTEAIITNATQRLKMLGLKMREDTRPATASVGA